MIIGAQSSPKVPSCSGSRKSLAFILLGTGAGAQSLRFVRVNPLPSKEAHYKNKHTFDEITVQLLAEMLSI